MIGSYVIVTLPSFYARGVCDQSPCSEKLRLFTQANVGSDLLLLLYDRRSRSYHSPHDVLLPPQEQSSDEILYDVRVSFPRPSNSCSFRVVTDLPPCFSI